MFGSSPIELMALDASLRGLVFCQSMMYPAKWNTSTAALTSGGTQAQPININGEADFVCQEINLIAWSAAGTLVADPNIELLIEIASGRVWFASAVNARLVAGQYAGADSPGRMGMPRLIASQSTVTVTLTDNQAVNWNRVEVSLNGFNVYYQGSVRSQVFNASS